MSSNVLSTIRNTFGTFKNSERKVAEFVLKDPNSVIGCTITGLANMAGTSEPTVIRFCRKIGLSGYMELRLSLARDLPPAQYNHECVSKSDTVPKIMEKVLSSASETIIDTMNSIDLAVLEEAVSAVASAKRVEFYGIRGSAAVAKDAHQKFFRLGVQCVAFEDPHMQAMSAALLTPEDVVIAFSYAGETAEIIESVKIAKNKGATVIGILGKEKSSLARLCDVVLTVSSHEAVSKLAPLSFRLTQIGLVNVLFAAVSMKKFVG